MFKLITLTFSLFFIIDSIGAIPVFLFFTKKLIQKEIIKTALLSSFIAGIILLFFAILGRTILSYFEVSIAALKVGGGLLLLYMVFEMIFAGQLFYQKADIKSLVVSPLAIPMLAGPGSMSFAMISFMSLEGFEKFYLILAIFLASLLSGIVLSMSSLLHKILGEESIRAMEKVTAIIISFIALEMIMSGIKVYFF